jgi:hypothetical protein
MSVRDEIVELATEVLEPNLQFYRRDPSDKGRYFVGPEVLLALAWVATNIAIPILVSTVNDVVKEQVKGWLKKRKEKSDPAIEPPEEIQMEVARILESRGGIAITDKQANEAVGAVSEYLSQRGWPKAFAKSDSIQIVEAIRQRVGATHESRSDT